MQNVADNTNENDWRILAKVLASFYRWFIYRASRSELGKLAKEEVEQYPKSVTKAPKSPCDRKSTESARDLCTHGRTVQRTVKIEFLQINFNRFASSKIVEKSALLYKALPVNVEKEPLKVFDIEIYA